MRNNRNLVTLLALAALLAGGCAAPQTATPQTAAPEAQQGEGHAGCHGGGHGHGGPGHGGPGHGGGQGPGGCPGRGGQGPAQDMGALCPARLPGVQIEAGDLDGGGVITFTTSADQLPYLRARVRAFADRFNRGGGCGGHGGGPGGCQGDARGRCPGREGGQPGGCRCGNPPPPAHAVAEDTPEGARLVVLAAGPEHVDALRQYLRERVERMHARQAEPSQPEAPQEEPPLAG